MKKREKEVRRHIGDYVFYAMIAVALLFVLKNCAKNHLLKDGYVSTKAVIIGHRNYLGNNNVAQEFTYSYRFCADDECYTNDSLDSNYKIGDTIIVKYYKPYPAFNAPMVSAR